MAKHKNTSCSIECQFCGKSFSNLQTLDLHTSTDHQNQIQKEMKSMENSKEENLKSVEDFKQEKWHGNLPSYPVRVWTKYNFISYESIKRSTYHGIMDSIDYWRYTPKCKGLWVIDHIKSLFPTIYRLFIPLLILLFIKSDF